MKDTNNEPVNDNLKTKDSIKPNEKHHRCRWCNELHPKSELHLEADFGFLCDNCIRAIESRGETLNLIS